MFDNPKTLLVVLLILVRPGLVPLVLFVLVLRYFGYLRFLEDQPATNSEAPAS